LCQPGEPKASGHCSDASCHQPLVLESHANPTASWTTPEATTRPVEVTALLVAWRQDDPNALDQLLPIVSTELHRLAHHYRRRERAGHTLQTTALVNEAYDRLFDASRVEWRDRAHFYAVCARLMRRILVGRARARRSLKRGGGARQVEPAGCEGEVPARNEDLLALDEALCRLSQADPRRGDVVELRYFGGFSVEETAEALGVSHEEVTRDWNITRLWLLHQLDTAPPA
jgi:RNA polymerase sigma factor (TIGR02999 family)